MLLSEAVLPLVPSKECCHHACPSNHQQCDVDYFTGRLEGYLDGNPAGTSVIHRLTHLLCPPVLASPHTIIKFLAAADRLSLPLHDPFLRLDHHGHRPCIQVALAACHYTWVPCCNIHILPIHIQFEKDNPALTPSMSQTLISPQNSRTSHHAQHSKQYQITCVW